jgi:hypothetical protein
VFVAYPAEKAIYQDASGNTLVPNLGSTTASAGSFTTLNSSGDTRLGGLSGNQSLQVNNVASAVNYAQIVGAVTGGFPTYSAQGADANITLNYDSKGTGYHYFRNGSGAVQFGIGSTASSINYLLLAGSAQFNSVPFQPAGSDASIGLAFSSKGSSGVSIFTSQFSSQAVNISHTASAVNYLNLTGAATTAAPTISAQGSDANISLAYDAKGTGAHLFRSASGATQFAITSTSGAVDYPVVTGGTGFLFIGVAGTSANIGFTIASKGAQGLFFKTGGSLQQVQISHAASAVNYLNLFGSATNSGTPANAAPTIAAAGSDTDINLRLTPKGTGTVQFGTYTAGVVAQAGYITITDAGGTSRRLLVG